MLQKYCEPGELRRNRMMDRTVQEIWAKGGIWEKAIEVMAILWLLTEEHTHTHTFVQKMEGKINQVLNSR